MSYQITTMFPLSLTELVWAIALALLHITATILQLFVPGFLADVADVAPSRPSGSSRSSSRLSSRLSSCPVSLLPPPPGLLPRLASLPPLPSLDSLSDTSSEYDYEDEEEEVPDDPTAQAHARCQVPEELSMKVLEDDIGNKYIAYRHCSHQLPWEFAPQWQRDILLPDLYEEEPAGDGEETG